MKCPICSLDTVWNGFGSETLVGFYSPSGHDHNDNCLKRGYVCANGHYIGVYLRRKCSDPACDWVGKKTCFCHEGDKVDEWPT